MARRFAVESFTLRSATHGIFIMQVNQQTNSTTGDGRSTVHISTLGQLKWHYSVDNSTGSDKIGVLSVNGTTYQLSNLNYDEYTVPGDVTVYDSPYDFLDALISVLPNT